MTEYLSGLNDKQREAVLHIDGPLMIVAGAGSGKTKVLTTRVAHLMANGVDSFNILALTFTNKAAKEMKERVEHILGNNEARNLYIGHFILCLQEFFGPKRRKWAIQTTLPFMIQMMQRVW
jgi:DNA helicase-2/ATP-dependent DNA helicase PcrA